MESQSREKEVPECNIRDDSRDAAAFEEGTQRGIIPGKPVLVGGVPEEVTDISAVAVPEQVVDSGAPINPHEYDPISQPDGIRCLVLESSTGDADDPLVCSLYHYSLADVPDFEAISYGWSSYVIELVIIFFPFRYPYT